MDVDAKPPASSGNNGNTDTQLPVSSGNTGTATAAAQLLPQSMSGILSALQAQVCASEGAAAAAAAALGTADRQQGAACSAGLPAAQALAELCSYVLASVSRDGNGNSAG
jgi:hypothetical protein